MGQHRRQARPRSQAAGSGDTGLQRGSSPAPPTTSSQCPRGGSRDCGRDPALRIATGVGPDPDTGFRPGRAAGHLEPQLW